MAVKEFSPIEDFEYSVRHIWVVLTLTLFGGAIGFASKIFNSPVYEAKSVIVVNIDFKQTGALTEYNLDHMVNTAGAMMASSSVLDRVVNQAQSLSREHLIYGRDLFRERKQESWELRVRNPDPQVAAILANLWAETAYQSLIEAQQHAIRAEALRGYLAALADCPPVPDLEPAPPPLCAGSSQEEIQHNLSLVEIQLQNELADSRGISPFLLIDISQRAEAPTVPIAYRTNLLVLAGALIGFVFGVGLVSSRLVPG